MNWGDPAYLAWLWAALPLGALLFALHRRRRRRLAALADRRALAHLIEGWREGRAGARLLLWFAALLLVGVALARPQWGFRWDDVRRRGLDILILLDTSRSMLAEDIKPNRLQQAKWGVRDLVHQLQGDRLGLVTFAGDSYLQCPLTIDYAAFLMTLDDVYVGVIPRGGTAIARALRTAIETFEKQSEGERVVILITDGEDHEGDPLALVDELKAKGVRVYAVGVGSLAGELVPAPEGAVGYLKDSAGHVVKSSLDETLLSRLALETGGAYVRAAPGDLGLERLMDQEIAALARAESDARVTKTWEERAGWFLAAALLLLAAEAALGERKPAPRRRAA